MDKIQTILPDYFDRNVQQLDQRFSRHQLIQLTAILQAEKKLLNPPLLDVGSGTGIIARILSQINPACRPIAEYDFSFQMMKYNHLNYADTQGIECVLGDAHHLAVRSDKINTVVCFSAFAHFDDKQQVLSEFYRVLKPDGILIILHLLGHKQLNKMHCNLSDPVENDYLPPVENLNLMLRQKGFSIQRQEEAPTIYLSISVK
ncbi:MAG: class I SAM-dependent methyltransferase [Calditrichales bacterium]|nr:MAG: class I SAM-dependent methyltransferase [Calditrichales bacterium]